MFDKILVIAAEVVAVVCMALFGIATLDESIEGMAFWGILAIYSHITASMSTR